MSKEQIQPLLSTLNTTGSNYDESSPSCCSFFSRTPIQVAAQAANELALLAYEHVLKKEVISTRVFNAKLYSLAIRQTKHKLGTAEAERIEERVKLLLVLAELCDKVPADESIFFNDVLSAFKSENKATSIHSSKMDRAVNKQTALVFFSEQAKELVDTAILNLTKDKGLNPPGQ